MTVRAGYVDGEWGQVHYRQAGDAGPWIVLFHESPLSSRVFEGVLARLDGAARVVAFDTPGYGASAPPPGPGYEIGDYARVLARAASALGVADTVLAGVHTGASLALEVAAVLTDETTGVVLSGIALLDEAERASYLSGWTPPIPVDADGSQFRWAIERYQRIWPELTPQMLQIAVVEVLRVADRYSWGYQAAFRHDPAVPLAATSLPVLLLDAEFDLLANKDALALKLAQNARLVVLAGLPGQPHLRSPEAYADELLAFALECSRPSTATS